MLLDGFPIANDSFIYFVSKYTNKIYKINTAHSEDNYSVAESIEKIVHLPKIASKKNSYSFKRTPFFYTKMLKRNLLLTFSLSNLLNQAGKQKIVESIGLTNQIFEKRRSFGLSLTWTIGSRFPIMSAGDGSGIANDTKK